MIIQLGGKKITKVSGGHDPDNKRPFRITFKPPTWSAATVYNKTDAEAFDVVVPTTFKGLYYAVDNPGKSHATTEPNWELTVGDTTTDYEASETEGLTWTAKAYNLLPLDEDVSDVTFSQTGGVTLVTDSFTTSSASFTIDAIDAEAAARTTNTFQVRARVTTSIRRFDVTLEFTLAEG
jgi:hypothetical protein